MMSNGLREKTLWEYNIGSVDSYIKRYWIKKKFF